jgi:hypothetical protein
MQASPELLARVQAGFILQQPKKSLHGYCVENGLDSSEISKYLRGDYTGEKATAAIEPVVLAACGVSMAELQPLQQVA